MGKYLSLALLALIVSMTACNEDTGVIKSVTKNVEMNLHEREYVKDRLFPEGNQYYDIQLQSGKIIHALGDIKEHKIGDTAATYFVDGDNWIIEDDEEPDTSD